MKCSHQPLKAETGTERDQRRLKEALDKEWGRQHGDTQTKANKNTKLFQDSMYAIFVKSRGFKDLKYYLGCLLVMTQTKTKIQFLHY